MSDSHSISHKTYKNLFWKVRLSVQIAQLLASISANAIMAASKLYHQKFMNPQQLPLSVAGLSGLGHSLLPIPCDGLADVGGAG